MFKNLKSVSSVLERKSLELEKLGTKRCSELFVLNAEEIEACCGELMAYYRGVLDRIAGQPENTYANTAQELADAEALLGTYYSSVYFPSYVDLRKECRKASSDSMAKMEAFRVECEMRADVRNAFARLKASASEMERLDRLQRRFVDEVLDDFDRNGLNLAAEKQAELKALRERISELCIRFQQNLNEVATTVDFSKEELDGLPESFLSSLKQKKEEAGGAYEVTTKYPHLFPILKMARRPETRRRILEASETIPANVPLLEEALRLRHLAAQLLGYETHAQFVLKKAMAKTPETVRSFLDTLRARLVPFAQQEKAALLEMKRADCEANGRPFDGELHAWDFRFYHNELLKARYELDEQLLKPYFPLQTVTRGMFEIYENMLGLRFEEVPQPYVWCDEVRLFAAHNVDADAADGEGAAPVGYFFMDLHPREGKYSHAAAFDLQAHYVRGAAAGGGTQIPVAAMVANFTRPTADAPALLEFSEVETYFHEFGHICHNLCSKSPVYRWSGTSVERDFVEAPSQMLENWCYREEALAKMSGHYQRPDEKLPLEFVRKIQAAKNLNSGLLHLRQIFFGLFDFTAHTQPATDTLELWQRLRADVSLIPAPPASNAASTFGHITGGYDSGYYGYLYSQVFSADMFGVFKHAGIFDRTTGRRYRDIILSRGRTVDSMDSVVEFLGRPPSEDAFLEEIGVK